MKIAIIGTRGYLSRYSGIETATTQAAVLLAKKGYELVFYCQSKSAVPHLKLPQGIRIVSINTINRKHLATFLHVLFSTLHVLFTDVNIVHYHALGPSFFALLPRLVGKKTVVTVHALDWRRKKWKYYAKSFLRICEYSANFLPNKTIVISRVLKHYFESKFKKAVYYIPNGINIPGLADNVCQPPVHYILFVGRIVPEKGIDCLIKAFNGIQANIRLLIAGGPGFMHSYLSYIKSVACTNSRIEFLGAVDTITLQSLYSNAYLFVLPSEVEGLSVSLQEAMSYGRCVLASDIPESREALEECGFYFKTGDFIDLRNKVQYLIDNPGIVSKTGLKARELVKRKYCWDKVINDLDELYQSLQINK
ncbi:MAG: glycosyltransferase family 4 protein [Candidatus Omnitrophota bacterium]|nr:glycosyltransferase family 4 protein [Candidatus Omnitrophota bacterium]